MYGVSPQAYDRAITVFSPDGRLFQVEYAKEAVRRGATSLGITGKDGVVLIAHKTQYSKLVIPSSVKKIFEVDEHIAFTASGLIADARKLVDHARLVAQRYRVTYGEPIPVSRLAKEVCDIMQAYTQYGGIRPFGVALLIAGYDTEPKLYEAEPSGAMTGYYADAIGNAKKETEEFLEKNYKQNMSLKECLKLGVQALKKSIEKKLTPDCLEICYINKTKKINYLSEKEIKALL